MAQDFTGARLIGGLTLGADPIAALTHGTGEWALRLLVATLAITPLRLISGGNWLLRLRRMLGLFVFFYALLHFCVYVFLDRGLDFSTVAEDVLERKFITVGFPAFLILIALAVTSPAAAVRKLGARRWRRLHRAAYAAAILAAVHFLWLRRGDDWGEPLAYCAAFALLFAVRIVYALKPERARHAG